MEILAQLETQDTNATHLNERRRKEAAQADVEDQTTLDNFDYGTGDNTVFFLDGFNRTPGALVLGALLGEDQPALFVFLLKNKGFDRIADGDNLVGVDVVLDRKFAGGNYALSFVTDVE